MGYGLFTPDGKDYLFNIRQWPTVLKIAFKHGWKPAGTEHPAWRGSDGEPSQLWVDPEEWDGTYCGNDGQYVTPEDALNLADALDRAIGNKSDERKYINNPRLIMLGGTNKKNDKRLGLQSITHQN